MTGPATAVSPQSFDNFGALLRYLRKRAELSQRELAIQVGFHYSYMSRIEANDYTPDAATLMARFIPALGLERDPVWTARMLEMAARAEPMTGSKSEPLAEAAFTPADSLVGSIPVSLTPLLGREAEVLAVVNALSRKDVRLVTLVGPPGIGKTRLAIEIANQVEGLFAHGVYFLDLALVTDQSAFPGAVARALGISERPDMPLMAGLGQAVKHKSQLLVLDNFEHLIDAAPQVHKLLIGAPGMKVLVTSRIPLHISGEHEFPVPPLSLPEEPGRQMKETDGVDLLQYTAIRLFVERARAVRPDFQLTSQNTAAVVEVCRRLDGLPLAIELAAARVKALTIEEMIKQFDRRFDWLAPTRRGGPSTKQTLHSAIEWSYNLLSEKEQILFQRLAAFSAGRTVEAAEAVCADDETSPPESTQRLHPNRVFDLLIQLADKSLLYTEFENGETRFNFLETIHDFAREKLAQSGEEALVRNRHLAYFCSLAERAEVELEGPDQVAWANRCEVEQPNMHAALGWSLREGADLRSGVRLAASLGLFWYERSHFVEGLQWINVFVQKARALQDEAMLAKLLFRSADLHLSRAEFDSAARLCNEALDLCRMIGDKGMLANTTYIQADLLLALGDLEAARKAAEQCIAISLEIDYAALEGIGRILLGKIFFRIGEQTAAHASLEQGLAIAAKVPDHWGVATAYRTLGEMYSKGGNHAQAQRAFERGLEPSRLIGDKFMTAGMLINLAVIANVQGDYAQSGRHAEEAFGIFQAVGQEMQQALPLRLMAYAAVHAGNVVRARVLAKESLRVSSVGGDDAGQLAGMVTLATCALGEGNYRGAMELCALIESELGRRDASLPEPEKLALNDIVKQCDKVLTKAAYRAAYEEGRNQDFELRLISLMDE